MFNIPIRVQIMPKLCPTAYQMSGENFVCVFFRFFAFLELEFVQKKFRYIFFSFVFCFAWFETTEKKSLYWKLKQNISKSTKTKKTIREVLERPSSQMSYLEHFLKESATSPISNNIYNNVPPINRPKMGISVMSSHSDHSEQHPATSPNSGFARPLVSPTSASQQPIYHNHPVISSPRSNYSLEDRDGVDRNLSFSSSKSNLSDDYNRCRSHQFVVRSFTTPTKCMHCTSLMVSWKIYAL